MQKQKMQWGHALLVLNLEGKPIRELRVRNDTFKLLRQIGLLNKRQHAVYEAPTIMTLTDRRLDPMVMQLRMHLGPDLTGPAWCMCNCSKCRKNKRPKEDPDADKQPTMTTSTSAMVAAIMKRRKYK
jgi:hypothetical protein